MLNRTKSPYVGSGQIIETQRRPVGTEAERDVPASRLHERSLSGSKNLF